MKKFDHNFQKVLGLFLLVLSSCSVSNKFNPPKNLPGDSATKRLVIFRASVTDINRNRNPTMEWRPDQSIIGIPSTNKRLINFIQPLSGDCTYVLEIAKTDTGSITFLMGSERTLFAKKFHTDTTIHFKDLNTGNNYWHLNYYLKNVSNIGWIPVLTFKEIDISKDSISSRSKTRFKYVLRYDLSGDTLLFEKKKEIVSNQKNVVNIYNRILHRSASIDSLLTGKNL